MAETASGPGTARENAAAQAPGAGQEPRFSHIGEDGDIRMVDVSGKEITAREAVAEGSVSMRPATLAAIAAGGLPKGDVLAAARIAGVMAAKKTAELIPMCHMLPLSAVQVKLEPASAGTAPGAVPAGTVPAGAASTGITPAPAGAASADAFLRITATVRCNGRTGVEMEALTAVAVAALTVYDMCKAVDRGMEIGGVHLLRKSGGKSGLYERGQGRPAEREV